VEIAGAGEIAMVRVISNSQLITSITMSIRTLTTVAITSLALTGASQAVVIYGLGSAGQLYRFDSANPGAMTAVGSGTASGVVDIDFRGSNRLLYGISASGSTSTYDLITGVSTPRTTLAPGTLNGLVSGFDVNPVADRFRVVTNASSQNNYRLTSPGADSTTVTPDGTFGTPLGVTILDVAYTNPFAAGTTALYSIGSNGVLYSHTTAVGDGVGTFNMMTAIGSLGVTLGSDIAFDIAQEGGIAYLANGLDFYTVNLGTGLATSAGTLQFGLSSFSAVPEPSSMLLGSLAGLALLRRRRTA
jgi:Domain of unknown function (DUF4394)